MMIMLKITYEGPIANIGAPSKSVVEILIDESKYSYGLGTATSNLFPLFNNIVPARQLDIGQLIVNHVDRNSLTSKYKVFYDNFGLKIEAKEYTQSIF